jgi:hypothetical protein
LMVFLPDHIDEGFLDGCPSLRCHPPRRSKARDNFDVDALHPAKHLADAGTGFVDGSHSRTCSWPSDRDHPALLDRRRSRSQRYFQRVAAYAVRRRFGR